jgi:Ca-activated chloride channel family protein
MRFANPLFLILIIVLIPLIYWHYLAQKKKKLGIKYSDTSLFSGINPSPKTKLKDLPKYIRYAVLVLLIIAFARPQSGEKSEEIYNQGIDIIMILDTSTSMQALDFDPENRFDMTKKVAKEFVKRREYDRIGIVVFSGLAYTQCPLTSDHEAVLNFIDQSAIGMTQLDGTAIGSAIATATNRLKDSPGKSKVIILITDGRNNMGEIDPITAAQAAAALDIKIYTIGAGKRGESIYPVEDPFFGKRFVRVAEQDLDEETLIKIADATKGKYFRATDRETFENIFKQIDTMEKVDIKTLQFTRYTELFGYFLWPAFILLMFEVLLSNLWLRRLP